MTGPSAGDITADAEALAFLIARCRDRAGHQPGWDRPGVTAVVVGLLANRTPVDQVLTAGCRAAQDPAARTPAVIRFHIGRAIAPADRPTKTAPPRICEWCGQPPTGHDRAVEHERLQGQPGHVWEA